MPKIVPIVEGDGELEAVPLLLRRILEDLQQWHVQIGRPKKSHGCTNLLKHQGVERFLQIAITEPDCAAIVVLIDADKNCPLDIANELAKRARAMNPRVPVTVVAANAEYEAWFLASIETIAGRSSLPANAQFNGDAEKETSPKGWIKTRMPKGTTYKETTDQVTMTSLIDLELARSRSRSFRRICHAVEEIVAAIDAGHVIVTPLFRDE